MNGILLIMQNSVFIQWFLMLFEVFLLFYSINFYTNWSNHSFQKRKSFKISGVFFSGNETSIISSDVGHSLKKNLRNTVKKKLIPIFLASAPWKHLAIHFIEPFKTVVLLCFQFILVRKMKWKTKFTCTFTSMPLNISFDFKTLCISIYLIAKIEFSVDLKAAMIFQWLDFQKT